MRSTVVAVPMSIGDRRRRFGRRKLVYREVRSSRSMPTFSGSATFTANGRSARPQAEQFLPRPQLQSRQQLLSDAAMNRRATTQTISSVGGSSLKQTSIAAVHSSAERSRCSTRNTSAGIASGAAAIGNDAGFSPRACPGGREPAKLHAAAAYVDRQKMCFVRHRHVAAGARWPASNRDRLPRQEIPLPAHARLYESRRRPAIRQLGFAARRSRGAGLASARRRSAASNCSAPRR